MNAWRMPPQPLVFPKNKRRARKGRVFPAVQRSARLYVYINPAKVHLFRFFLEAEDNLGIMTVVDRWRAALLIRYSPHQERRMLEFMKELKFSLDFEGPFRPC